MSWSKIVALVGGFFFFSFFSFFSFQDHLFGSLSNVNGLKGKNFSNWVNNTDHSKGSVAWTWSATDLNSCDPNHNVDITSDKIYGIRQAEAFNFSSPSMDGFVEAESMLHKEKAKALNYCEVMTGFDDGQLPVLNFLAKNFALFDEYFCSVPGPTFPNRFFALTGTAAGLTNTGPFFRNSSSGLLFPQKTIFEQLAEEGHDCAFYYKGTPWELQLRGVIHNPEMLHPFDDFLRSAKDGTLPSFSFINPLAGIEPGFDSMKGCNDFHPDHSVALGSVPFFMFLRFLKKRTTQNEKEKRS
jgi:phospholipase C